MPITPKNSKIKFILVVLFLFVIFFTFYFKARSVRTSVIVDIPKMGDHVATVSTPVLNTIPFDTSASSTASSTATSTQKVKGSYKTWNDESQIKNAKDGVVTVLFFNALWSPECQATDKELLSRPLPDDLYVLNVDYDSFATVKKKYNVTSPDTFIEVDKAGNEIQRWSGGGLDTIIKNTHLN